MEISPVTLKGKINNFETENIVTIYLGKDLFDSCMFDISYLIMNENTATKCDKIEYYKTKCVHCGTFCQNDSCPYGHDGTKCIHCGSLCRDNMCPHEHNGKKCIHCGTFLEDKYCPYGHDGTECKHCGSFHNYGHCQCKQSGGEYKKCRLDNLKKYFGNSRRSWVKMMLMCVIGYKYKNNNISCLSIYQLCKFLSACYDKNYSVEKLAIMSEKNMDRFLSKHEDAILIEPTLSPINICANQNNDKKTSTPLLLKYEETKCKRCTKPYLKGRCIVSPNGIKCGNCGIFNKYGALQCE
ncbi:hypothetical protein [Acanthamoeba polyphaga mimivirus]|uniref:4Fe-4S ferredoxin-type domain-containing protein n=1 Tax=Acanthamoeba polyphaga mimivirus TaxID=212035 RepID=A0A2L2DKG2_MIMIV|nr:hypothetical protein [Acanthamoeba polyphaga mimivirus]